MLSVGALRVQCTPTVKDGVARLAVSRGLLTCCRPHVLLSSHVDATEVNLDWTPTSKTFLLLVFCSLPSSDQSSSFFFRRVCCSVGCFPWSTLCVRRSWIVTTLYLKVSNVQIRLIHVCVNGVTMCLHITCRCSVNVMAEESQRMSA